MILKYINNEEKKERLEEKYYKFEGLKNGRLISSSSEKLLVLNYFFQNLV